MQACSVKDLPDMERLKSTKFTGLRWDIDPVLVEYFRYLLNDVVASSTRRLRNSSGQKADNSRYSSSSSSSSSSRLLVVEAALAMVNAVMLRRLGH